MGKRKFNLIGTNSDWDDTALIKAYDDAINSFKNKLNANYETLEDTPTQNKGHKKIKKEKSKEIDECRWQVGDKCLAKFSEDEIFYEAFIISINSAKQTCKIKYSYYGNEELHDMEDLRECKINDNSSNRSPTLEDVSDDNATVASDCGSSQKQNSARCDNKSSSFGYQHFPRVPPPPLPDLSSITSESDALQGMLISWYMSGYYTGYYEGRKFSSKEGSSRP